MKKTGFQIEKRGLSPVIATTLLILIAIIIAIIILLWIKNYIGEKAEKDLGGGPIALENVCPEVKLDADAKFNDPTPASSNSGDESLDVHVGNKGNVPIYGIEVRKKSLTSVISLGAVNTKNANLAITSGEDETLPITGVGGKVEKDNSIIVVPIVLGENKKAKRAYVCEEQYGVEVKVS